MTKRLHVDWTACTGRGVCAELLSGVVRTDDWGYPLAEGGTDIVVPGEREGDARDAVALCPRLALTWRDRRRP